MGKDCPWREHLLALSRYAPGPNISWPYQATPLATALVKVAVPPRQQSLQAGRTWQFVLSPYELLHDCTAMWLYFLHCYHFFYYYHCYHLYCMMTKSYWNVEVVCFLNVIFYSICCYKTSVSNFILSLKTNYVSEIKNYVLLFLYSDCYMILLFWIYLLELISFFYNLFI